MNLDFLSILTGSGLIGVVIPVAVLPVIFRFELFYECVQFAEIDICKDWADPGALGSAAVSREFDIIGGKNKNHPLCGAGTLPRL